METVELRDFTEARQFLTQGLWWQRVLPVHAARLATIHDVALAIASEGHPLPPLGFLADAVHLVWNTRASPDVQAVHVPGIPVPLLRAYEDYGLGKLLIDASFERAGDAVRSYQAKEQVSALAFVINHVLARAGFAGVHVGPAVIKAVREIPAGEILAEGWQSYVEDGPMPLLVKLYEELIQALRNAPALLASEDLFELEHKTALIPFGQRVALRQVLQAAKTLADDSPRYPPRAASGGNQFASNILVEDTYPVGGFSSISTRGTMESLLQSQLALMEPDNRPDLFDLKYLRDELLYYSRDDNSFHRRRRLFIFELHSDLIHARFKDRDLPFQRIVYVLAFLCVAVQKAIEWLSADALRFEFVFCEDNESALGPEKELLQLLLADEIANDIVAIKNMSVKDLVQHTLLESRRSQSHYLSVGSNRANVETAAASQLVIDGTAPSLIVGDRTTVQADGDTWTSLLETLLTAWVS